MSATTRTYEVPSISCAHCKQSIESGLGALDGVESVEVDIDAKSVLVAGSATEEAVRDALDGLGYDVAAVS